MPVGAELLGLLADPFAKLPLAPAPSGDELVACDGRRFPIRAGIPRFTVSTTGDQEQTRDSFGFKWRQRNTFESQVSLERAARWLCERYGFASPTEMSSWFSSRERVLDAGCGAGFSASTWLERERRGIWVGVDISEAVDVACERLGTFPQTYFVQADLMRLPFAPETFDTVFSEGVLHHTPSTRDALHELLATLAPGGEALFYVYRRKAPIRELADDHLRGVLSGLPPEEAWEQLRPLTRLAEALANLGVSVRVPEDVPLLEIRAGDHDIQRLLYWHFAKLFWNSGLSFEENVHVNFDWYHPRYAHRHTEQEILSWCEAEGLDIRHLDVQESGITVRGVKA